MAIWVSFINEKTDKTSKGLGVETGTPGNCAGEGDHASSTDDHEPRSTVVRGVMFQTRLALSLVSQGDPRPVFSFFLSLSSPLLAPAT